MLAGARQGCGLEARRAARIPPILPALRSGREPFALRQRQPVGELPLCKAPLLPTRRALGGCRLPALPAWASEIALAHIFQAVAAYGIMRRLLLLVHAVAVAF